MSEAEAMKYFEGVLTVSGGRAFLTAGGLEAELLPGPAPQEGGEASGPGAQDLETFAAYDGRRVSVRGRQEGAKIVGAQIAGQPESGESAGVSRGGEGRRAAFARVLSVLRERGAELQKSDVLSVRPGYKLAGGEITGTPAIVVTVGRKLPPSLLPEEERIPPSLGGVPVDVRQADPLQAVGGGSAFNWERFFETGEFPPSPEAAPSLSYERWPSRPLEVTRVQSITCHVSPDTGLETLREFLAGTEERLTVAIYDFTSRSIFEALLAATSATEGDLSLIIDPNRRDLEAGPEAEFKNRLKDRLDERFRNWSWAATGGPKPLFLNSYHTKVAVRDGRSFWLSSGNWTPSSQPAIPPGPQPHLYAKGNREWHVIVENQALAQLFEAYIKRDIEQALARWSDQEAAPAPLDEMPDLLVPEDFFAEPEAIAVQPEPFASRTFTSAQGIKVLPLLSPDNYVDEVLKLVDSATESLYLQYSYIRFPEEDDRFRQLIKLIARKVKEGVDVKIIASRAYQISEHTDGLVELGITGDHFRLQKSKLHNKGILVDSKVALVSSQNWSRDGVLYNRDAGLIIYDARVARYYEKVFLFDWDNLTRSAVGPESSPVVAPEGMEVTPAGMVRVPWKSFYG